MPQLSPPTDRHREIGFPEFVGLMAMLMALTALSIDVMLVALADISSDYFLADANDRQLVITAYLLGFAVGQPVWGPLSDRIGRKPVLIAGLVIYGLGCLGAMVSPSFETLLAARLVQGLGGASPRVMTMAVVRDRYAGSGMARVMSLLMMIFIIVPILAPTMGSAVMAFAPWHWLFGFMLVFDLIVLVWTLTRLRETHRPQRHLAPSLGGLLETLRVVVSNRQTVGYTVAFGFMMGSLMGYVGTAQQVFVEVYNEVELFPILFGAIASAIAAASIINARFVTRIGSRRMSHAALLGFVAIGLVTAAFGFPAKPPLVLFMAALGIQFFCFGLIGPNFNAMAMEPMGRVAGAASSFVGFYSTAASAFLGWAVGQQFDGSVRPLMMGFAGFGVLALVCVLITERGRLFRRAAA
ncbi:MFS transporter [Rhodospirillum rubrum]|uniref:multidrug effflux MFS transporter n=1 Tax=Rhodospirillum rubrum TaxID=1085 RepID=UPI001902E5AB|nr:multidrug effflux MFS transporter [Rhodospirillum rubrum]MBK1664471.1 MFS transporter [Rhodospirillum rubrum]MBK1676272.1 MFS transporter [Rhodospirillum rubrum]